MAKKPTVGFTKTRLFPPLLPHQASALYEALLLDTIALGTELKGVDLAISVTPPNSIDYFQTVAPPDALLLPVECPDIGSCLSQVLEKLIYKGYKKAFAINSDGPSLPPDYLHQAIRFLDDSDLVLGPSEDGGYYLVGIKQHQPDLFIGITWSTSRVLSQTISKASNLGLQVALLPKWFDIDTWEDFVRLEAELEHLPPDRLKHTRRFVERFSLKSRQT
jgi:hypothetical protein